MGRDQKKQDKRKKRERKNAERQKYAERAKRERERRDRYPKIIVDPTNGDPEFVELVRTALNGMDFDDPDLFRPAERHFYRMLRKDGFSLAHADLKEAMRQAMEEGDNFGKIGEAVMLLGFGSHLLSRIPEAARRRLMPYNDVLVLFLGRNIKLTFSSMLSERGGGGTIFYSRRKPTVELGGKQWTVAFSRHSVERICERLNPRYINYGAAGDVHAFFGRCVYFEPLTLYGNQPAFALYDRCDVPGFQQYTTYTENILGKENVDPTKGTCYYRVGYCPVVFEGAFAKAKTFLFPGYKSTPEFGLVLKSQLSRTEKDLLLQQAMIQDATEVLVNDNLDTIKWFHDNGVPQVVQMANEVFLYDDR